MFNFRLINTPDGNQIIDCTLKTPYNSLTPLQMVEYMEIDINNTMKEVNPIDYTYGDTSNNYVYYYSNLNNAYFISAYSKTNYLEDRAVIFSDLMSRRITKDYYNYWNQFAKFNN